MPDFAEELRNLKSRNLLRKPFLIESSFGPRITISGKEFINFSSNDYLNLAGHPEIVRAAAEALEKYGFGSGSSRLLSGSLSPHKELEERIAEFRKTESALVFNSGYSANSGIIPAIAGSGDVIFSDELNHASIVDGIRLSEADVKIYRHADMEHLEGLLKDISLSIGSEKRRCLIITDTVFSMDGDIAPLKDIYALSVKYDALVMVDDAHGTGVLGKGGSGALEHFGIEADDIIQMGTFSKAFGCYGAYAAGQVELTELLINKARSLIYSTSLPPSVAVACIKSVDIVKSETDDLRERLWKNRERLFMGLRDMGFDTLGSETPIVPVLAGDVSRALRIGEHLYSNNVFAPAIRPPTVPEGRCRIRFSVTAAHTEMDIDSVLGLLGKFKKRNG